MQYGAPRAKLTTRKVKFVQAVADQKIRIKTIHRKKSLQTSISKSRLKDNNPISVQVLPYFKCSENNTEIQRVGRKYHSTGGLLNVERFPWKPDLADDILAAAAERGYPISEDLNGDQFTGFTVAQSTSKDGVRISSAAAFLRPYRSRRNLQIALNATATKIIIENERAVGVQYYQVSRCASDCESGPSHLCDFPRPTSRLRSFTRIWRKIWNALFHVSHLDHFHNHRRTWASERCSPGENDVHEQ